MMNFQKINNIAGWSIFGLATVVYLITVEETASFWDVGEFIASSYKLQIPHPPGAPLFLLIGRIFSFLALGDVENVAYWINVVSVFCSSFSILFLFWTITLLGRKMMNKIPGDEITLENTILLIGAGAVGALAYTFSDSFWFSAVEAEVYAMSSFFTAFVVWAILKWDVITDESKENRWLILIAYVMGLSIGVHLLNLVTIPALALIYYFKKYRPSMWGTIATLAISGFIIIIINSFIIPGLPTIAGKFEIFFVNTLGLGFGTGALFFTFIILGLVTFGVIYSQKHQKQLLNTAMLSLAFILIGYASYSVILVRSNFDPPIDQNDPEDAMSFVKYLKREQYGTRPLLTGPYFTADPIGTEEGDVVYIKGEENYIEANRKFEYKYDPAETTILPRIYSRDHAEAYREILNLGPNEVPTFGDNIYFMLKHQLGTMYFRYFLWNFMGRQSDIKGAGTLTILDAFKEVPEHLEQNKGRNNFFMIPLILGLVGMIYHGRKDTKGFVFVAMLFFLTGIALILYLNSPPVEPRERDYIYVGSYYAFAIWIGFAVIALAKGIKDIIKNGKTAAIISLALCLTAPAIMAQQGWDDHDRSNRWFSVDSAKNFLASVAPNAILFTGGDNDTFPLWYVQEVEGFRTDVRVVVLSYFNTDWYINQMTRQVYESEPFPFTLTYKNYRQGGPNDYLPHQDMGVSAMNLEQFISLIAQDDKRLRAYPSANVVPSKNFILNVDREKVIEMDFIPENKKQDVVDKMRFSLKPGKTGLEKKDLMILDILATNNWERPVYLNNTSMQQINMDLSNYSIQEGNAYRIIPIEKPNPEAEFVNTEVMYKNVLENFYYRELDNPDVYYNEDYRGLLLNHRSTINTLAAGLVREGEMEKAKEVLLFSLEKMPDKSVPYDYSISRTVSLLYRVGEIEKAKEVAQILGDRAIEMTEYYIENNMRLGFELQKHLIILGELQRTLYQYGEDELAKKYDEAYQNFARRFRM
ncbi:MAG: glycosyltransferase family 117 protein [Candidatus Cyclobacteriaceae bacterium M2_1C_046]